MKRLFAFITLVLASMSMAGAEYSDKQLYEGYLTNDFSLWTAYINNTDWSTLNTEERMRYINYEYGYVPFMADQKNPNARRYLDQYKAHLEEEKCHMTEAQYTAYLCAANAYEYLLDKKKLFSAGLQSFKLAKKAVELDDNNPIGLLLKANVNFHAPKGFGGNKEEALRLFLKAEKIMRQEGTWRYLWNYPALQLCIAQCYEELGEKEKAISKCESILQEHPKFNYVRNTYLPALRAKKK
ncbi:MAG: hypothetical protein MJZ82_02510 [Paludibacteraceae bacterium]|nr:hypothetical protein [Paludibacteraceae bacterium]